MATTVTAKEFPAKVVRGIVSHVNEDHVEEMLMCAHGFGAAWATGATLEGFDRTAMMVRAVNSERSEILRLEFSKPVTANKHIQAAMLEVIANARQRLRQEFQEGKQALKEKL
jgi:putative heme iron utilization protein